ncbi:hypothetical protein EG833_03020 [archaeon]|nr:hypothetical protein [archaeon]
MGLDDLFKNNHHHKHGKHYDDHDGHRGSHDPYNDDYSRQGDHHYRGDHHGHNKAEMILSVLRSLPHKKAIIIGVITACLLVLVIGIAILWAVVPMIAGALGLVDVKSIQELVIAILSLIQKFASGG